MLIGLYDADSTNFPNLPLMKLSAFHKQNGDTVSWAFPVMKYSKIYISKVFTWTKLPDTCWQADVVDIGGSGCNLTKNLPDAVEKTYPDYSLYPDLTKDTAFGFLTRGCPRGCDFCIVKQKEGGVSRKVSDLSGFWKGQKNIKLLDPNILACRDRMELLESLASSQSWVDFTQGIDIRLMNHEILGYFEKIRTKMIHFAWDREDDEKQIVAGLRMFSELKFNYRRQTVYILTNFNTSLEYDLHRIYTVRDMGYTPYVMVFDKKNAPAVYRKLQRWCNTRIFWVCRSFENYSG